MTNIFDYCASPEEKQHLFIVHGVLGSIIIIVAFCAAAFSVRAWYKLPDTIKGRTRIYVRLLFDLDLVYCGLSLLRYTVPYIARTPPDGSDIDTYRSYALGHVILPLMFGERFIRIVYGWLMLLIAKINDRRKPKKEFENRNRLLERFSNMPECVKHSYYKNQTTIKALFPLVLIGAFGFASSLPMLFGWQREQTRSENCGGSMGGSRSIIAIRRTDYGNSGNFIWVYNRLYIVSSLGLPVLLLTILSARRLSEHGEGKNRRVNQMTTNTLSTYPESQSDADSKDKVPKHVPEWLIIIVCLSYVPSGVYAALEHLQSQEVDLGLPDVGVGYMIHLSVTIFRTLIGLKWHVLKTAALSDRIPRTRQNRIHSLVFPDGPTTEVQMTTTKSLKERQLQEKEEEATNIKSQGSIKPPLTSLYHSVDHLPPSFRDKQDGPPVEFSVAGGDNPAADIPILIIPSDTKTTT